MVTPLLRAAEDAPRVALDHVAGTGEVLVLAPHPDDETLGCGAALAALAAQGRRAQVVLVTDGCGSHPRSLRCPPARMAALRAREAREALRILGQPRPVRLGFADRSAPEKATDLSRALARLRPLVTDRVTAIWASWGGDPHCDHVRTARLAQRLARDLQRRLWFYPIWGRFADACAPPRAMVRLNPAGQRARKRRALAAHRSQMTGLIPDDPEGFTMHPDHQRHFIDHDEIFIPHEDR